MQPLCAGDPQCRQVIAGFIQDEPYCRTCSQSVRRNERSIGSSLTKSTSGRQADYYLSQSTRLRLFPSVIDVSHNQAECRWQWHWKPWWHAEPGGRAVKISQYGRPARGQDIEFGTAERMTGLPRCLTVRLLACHEAKGRRGHCLR